MKGYKNLIPIALILFSMLGCYTRLDDAANKQQQYDNFIQTARDYGAEKIYVDAYDNYMEAINRKDSLDLRLEVGKMLFEEGKEDKIISWGEQMIEKYPMQVEAYEYLIDYYYQRQNYDRCFSYYEIVKKRKLDSTTLTAKMNSILYEYDFIASGFQNVTDFSGEYAVIQKDDVYGYINTNGGTLLEPQYQYAGAFEDVVAPVKDENGEFYFVNIDGDRKLNYASGLDVSVSKLGYIGDNLYPVGNEEKIYYANTQGEVVLGPYQDGSVFNYERAAVKEKDKWYLIDTTGKKLSDGYVAFVTDFKQAVFRNGVAFAQAEDGYYMLNTEGKRINKKPYEDAKCFLDNSYAAVKQDGLWGFVDKEGKELLTPCYEDANSFRNGFAAVKQDGLWGFLNLEGEMAIVPNFTDAKSMSTNGTAFVKQQEREEWSLLRLIRYKYDVLKQ